MRVGTLVLCSIAALGCREPAGRDPSVSITPLPLPRATLERADGHSVPLAPAGPTLLHFWATWCAPCRRELPALLEAAGVADVRVIAVTDESWADVRAHFGARGVPATIARDPERALSRALGVGALPDTYLIGSDAIARRRIAGTLDWSDPAVRAWMSSLSQTRAAERP